MKFKQLKSSVFVYASAALLSMSASAPASGSGYYEGYCSDKLAQTESDYNEFMITYSDGLSSGASTTELVRLQAIRANYLYKISNFSFADCTCDDDDDCDMSPT